MVTWICGCQRLPGYSTTVRGNSQRPGFVGDDTRGRVEREPVGGGGPGERGATRASVEGHVEPDAGAGDKGPDQRRGLNDSGLRDWHHQE